jgi:hypothetical protein
LVPSADDRYDGEEKTPDLVEKRTLVVRPVASHFTCRGALFLTSKRYKICLQHNIETPSKIRALTLLKISYQLVSLGLHSLLLFVISNQKTEYYYY